MACYLVRIRSGMAACSKAEYLQRYLSSDKDEAAAKKKKKRRTKEATRAAGLRIVEDDAFIAVSAQFKNVDSDEEKEDIAIISSITKQVEEKAREAPRFRNSFQPLDEVKCEPSSPSAEARKSESYVGSDDDDLSQSRRKAKCRHDSDSDQSPQRYRGTEQMATKRHHEADQSSSRRHDRRSTSISPRRHRSSHKESSNAVKVEVDSDLSPPRKVPKHHERKSHGSDSDQSPPRRQRLRRHGSQKNEVDSDQSPPRKGPSRGREESDSDQSPPRKPARSRGRRESDSDESPPRKHARSRGRRESDSDQSLPRKHDKETSHGSRRRTRHDNGRTRDQDKWHRNRRVASPELLSKEAKRTLDGKIAGLQSADDLKKESEELRKREEKMFEELDASISGRDAVTTLRQKQVRKGKDKPEDKERKEREAKKQAELQEKYDLWNKGVAQTEKREQQLEEMARVAAEPLARMVDDEEMNKHLKEIVHEEDPMAPMLQSKKREAAIDRGDLVYPTYQGECPPNRFGIRPGYRWDGVDRSNGFEAKLAQAKNARNAQDREFYQNIQLYE
ncbi:hypothetical protein KIN20_025547 [Parelaphostrongylus tenuis]|uniref:BUD13 homolog n=1 Tax=Parelaphostrongylus tenuis TaxID=148309 RepID=A0AAD5QXS9_PARTN|nr:hypothetical protein KIN20_025547 [Parelaphostrongylus tenuis]